MFLQSRKNSFTTVMARRIFRLAFTPFLPQSNLHSSTMSVNRLVQSCFRRAAAATNVTTRRLTPSINLSSQPLNFSTVKLGSKEETSQRSSKSPHSKLLRVCSARNANPHFAAIEAELLRLDWKEAMDALVSDWQKDGRWDNLLELENNVRNYVDKNLPYLSLSFEDEDEMYDRTDGGMPSMKLVDRIRLDHFPYETIISGAVKHAISGDVILIPSQIKDSDLEMQKIMAELYERISMLSNAGKLLDTMTNFELESGTEDETTWTAHRTACSNCYRLVVSGWFLLWRRLREANKQMIEESEASEVLKATSAIDIHPEEEIYVWSNKWIDFCTLRREVEGEESEDELTLLGGIAQKDKALMMGVSKMMSLSEKASVEARAAELNKQIELLFP